jgi:hypothetical protein
MAKTFDPEGRHTRNDLKDFDPDDRGTFDRGEKFFAPGPAHVADMFSVKPGRVLLVGETGERVLARLHDPPQVLGGGGIEAVPRPLRRPLTAYRGVEAPGIVLSILLDGWRARRSVERACRKIERMAGAFVSDDPGPEELTVISPSVPHCWGTAALDRTWVISEQPTWGDDPEVLRRRSDGHRLRQQVTLTLLVHTDAVELQRISPRQSKPDTRIVHATERLDTYSKLAGHYLETKRLGYRLAKFNGDRDAHKHLHKGKRVKLPSRDKAKDWRNDLKHGR